jgi:hypothetical protein
MNEQTTHNHTTGGRVSAECRPYNSLTAGSLMAMTRITEARGKLYYDTGQIEKWINNRDLTVQLELELASRN